ncbi:MAG TPA: hypothetical protein K8V00_02855 [Ligilactobacillus acidipiscis]|uniref:Uncharacterized protein n=1 Tax=Ligilactobacillus acidipiscis TaxID=89059 RepID=A0A921F7S2_9LACO|nr:hypothetical protein [Ligilactobacillus acidipiscis]
MKNKIENTEFKIAAILDVHSIAINITKEDAEKYEIFKGNRVKVISKKINIKDPNNPENSLGKYTLYKDELEITEINNNFSVAQKFYTEKNNNFPLSIGTQKKLGTLTIEKPEDFSFDRTIRVGDQVDIFK